MCLRLREFRPEYLATLSNKVYLLTMLTQIYVCNLSLKTDSTVVASGSEEMYPCVKRTCLGADCTGIHQTTNPAKSRE